MEDNDPQKNGEGQTVAPPLYACAGMRVKIELITETGPEFLSVELVSDKLADVSSGFLGEGTPLAQAVMGHKAGDTILYTSGDILSIKILEVCQGSGEVPQEVLARRQEIVRKAVEESDRTNALIFASSFSGKWGDYDPTGIEQW